MDVYQVAHGNRETLMKKKKKKKKKIGFTLIFIELGTFGALSPRGYCCHVATDTGGALSYTLGAA